MLRCIYAWVGFEKCGCKTVHLEAAVVKMKWPNHTSMGTMEEAELLGFILCLGEGEVHTDTHTQTHTPQPTENQQRSEEQHGQTALPLTKRQL